MKNFIIAVLLSFVAWTTGLMGAIVYFMAWVILFIVKKLDEPLDMDGAMLLTGAIFGYLITANIYWLIEVFEKNCKPPSG